MRSERLLAQGVEVHEPARRAGDLHHLVAGHGGGGQVGAVGRVGHDDGVAVGAAVVAVVGPDHEYAGQFAVGAGGRLQGGPVHAGDLQQGLLGLVHQREHALHLVLRPDRGAGRRSPAERADLVVQLGVVLHGARAQRIEARVHGVVEVREPGVVAHHLRLAHSGSRGRVGAQGDAGQQGQPGRRSGTPAGGRSVPRCPGVLFSKISGSMRSRFMAAPSAWRRAAT